MAGSPETIPEPGPENVSRYRQSATRVFVPYFAMHWDTRTANPSLAPEGQSDRRDGLHGVFLAAFELDSRRAQAQKLRSRHQKTRWQTEADPHLRTPSTNQPVTPGVSRSGRYRIRYTHIFQ